MGQSRNLLRIGDAKLDHLRCTLTVFDNCIELTRLEAELLKYWAQEALQGRHATRYEDAYCAAWATAAPPNANHRIQVAKNTLASKLSKHGVVLSEWMKPIPGVGYDFFAEVRPDYSPSVLLCGIDEGASISMRLLLDLIDTNLRDLHDFDLAEPALIKSEEYAPEGFDSLAESRECTHAALVRDHGEDLSVSVKEVGASRVLARAVFPHSRAIGRAIRELALMVAKKISSAVAPGSDRLMAPKENAALPHADADFTFQAGLVHWRRRHPRDIQLAVNCFERAVELDPGLSSGHVALAMALCMNSFGSQYCSPQATMPRARAEADAALELDEFCAEALAVRGFVSYAFDWDARQALECLTRAASIPGATSTCHQWLAGVLSECGNHADALAATRRAIAMDADSPMVAAREIRVLYFAGDLPRAVEVGHHVTERFPGFSFASVFLGQALLAHGLEEDAIRMLGRAVSESPGNLVILGELAFAHAVAGRPEEARRVLSRVEGARDSGQYVSSFVLSRIHMGLRNWRVAASLLREAIEERSCWIPGSLCDPALEEARSMRSISRCLQMASLNAGR